MSRVFFIFVLIKTIMDLYNIFLNAHKGFGYLMLVAAVVFLVALIGVMFGNSGKITKLLRKSTLFTMILFHIQLLVGLPLLFFFSPGFKAALDSGTLMSDAYSRVTYVEHPFSMLIGAVLLTIINKYLKKHEDITLKVVFMGLLAIALLGYVFPWARVFGN